MSAASMKRVTTVPSGGARFNLSPGLKINSITPLGTGNLVIKPASPLGEQTTETITITEQLVGATFPGFGQEIIQEGTTALPLLVVFASEGSPMYPVFVPGASNASQAATSANQELALAAIDQIYDALLLVGKDATSGQILAAVANLGNGSTLADLASALAPIATEATQESILEALEAVGVDIDDIRSNIALLVPDLDAVRVAVQAMQALLAGGLPAALSNGRLKTEPAESTLGGWIDRDPLDVPVLGSGAAQLPNYSCTELKIIADENNANPVYFGGSNVSPTKSQKLAADEVEYVKRAGNANNFYVVAKDGHTGLKIRIQTR